MSVELKQTSSQEILFVGQTETIDRTLSFKTPSPLSRNLEFSINFQNLRTPRIEGEVRMS